MITILSLMMAGYHSVMSFVTVLYLPISREASDVLQHAVVALKLCQKYMEIELL